MPFAQVEGEKGSTETETEERRAMKDAGLFQVLYAMLDEKRLISRKIDGNVVPKSILEVEGRIELPALETALYVLCDQLAPLLETLRTRNPQAWRNIQMINRFRALSPLNLRIIPSSNQYTENMANVNVIASLRRNMLRKPLHELADDYSVFCRVKKILKNDQTYDLLKLPIKLDDEKVDGLLKSFENIPPESKAIFGNSLSREDIQVRCPAIIVIPIAIYR